LLASTALVAVAMVAPEAARSQSIIINDVRIGTQNLDLLLPMGAPATALVTSTGSVTAPAPGAAAIIAATDWLLLTNNGLLSGAGNGVSFTNSATIVNTGTIQQTGGGGGLVNNGIFIGGTGSVTNSGTISGVTGIQIAGAGTVTNQTGGLVSGGIFIGGTATVFQSGKTGVVVNDGFVDGQIRLNQGGTITNNGSVFGLLFPGGLIIDNAPGTVINTGNAGTVFLGAGGTVSNSGTIANIDLPDGVSIAGGNGTVTNSGLIQDESNAVTITNSGTVTNTGTIQQTGGGSGLVNNGIHIGETGSVTNSGTISGVTGIQIDGAGTVANQLGGTVDGGILIGGQATVFQSGKTGVVVNDGFVTSQIVLNQGGTITNNGSVFGLLGPGFLSIFNASGTVINTGHAGAVFLGAGGSVTNSGTISNIDLANGVFIDGGDGTVSNSGLIEAARAGVTITNSGTVTNSGTISGNSAASFAGITIGSGGSVSNSGTITGFNAVQIYNGDVSVSNQAGGRITGTSSALQFASANATVTNGGTITANNFYALANQGGNNTITNNGRIETLGSGPAVLLVDGLSNTIVNNGVIASNGAIAISMFGFFPANDTVILQSNSFIQGNVQASDGTDGLILQGSNSDDIGKFLDFETLRMEGVDWTLTGAGTIANSSEIVSGTLRVNGQLTTPILTVTSGTLAGSGTVHGNVLASTGNVAPGPAGTTLSVDGGLTMASASRFLVDIVNTSNSRVNVLGANTATLQGGQIGVTFAPPPNTLLNNVQYTVLHADGGVGGTFGNSVINIGSYRFTVSYDPDDVFLNLTRTAFNDPSLCASANQCAVGGALERLGPVIPGELGSIVGNLALLDIATQQAALASMSGAQHSTLSLLALDGGALFGQSVTRRLVNRRNAGAQSADAGGGYNVAMLGKPDGLIAANMPSAPGASNGAWFRGYGASGALNGDSNATGANYFVGGAAMGIDRLFAPGFTAGVSVGYATTRADFNGSNSSGRINAYDIGLYGSYQTGGFHFDAVATFAWLDNKVDRQIVVGDLVRNTDATYHGQRFGLALETGYDFNLGGFTVQPTVGMTYVHLRQNAFHEDGAGGLDLDGKRSSADSLRGSAGVRLGTRFMLGSVTIGPELRGRFEHEFLDNRVSTDVNFTGQAPAGEFTVVGVKVPRNSMIVGGGLAALITPWTSAFVDYDYKFNKDQKIHNLTAGLRFEF
jgi:outer membrane autotransporter protein